MRDDVGHREVVRDERIGEAAEGKGDEQRLHPRRRPRERDPRGVAARSARDRHERLHERYRERERERELAELRNHRVCSVFCVRSTAARSMACFASGGM